VLDGPPTFNFIVCCFKRSKLKDRLVKTSDYSEIYQFYTDEEEDIVTK
jgi:hypothetical protein